MTDDIIVSRAALHMWEETCISGSQGSGTVFFAGCNMGCVYCQNYKISGGISEDCDLGRTVSPDELAEIFLKLMENVFIQEANAAMDEFISDFGSGFVCR